MQLKAAHSDTPNAFKMPSKKDGASIFTSCSKTVLHLASLPPQEEYIKFGPTLVLHCRAPSWTAPVEKVGVEIVELRGRPALTRYLAKTYMDGEVKET